MESNIPKEVNLFDFILASKTKRGISPHPGETIALRWNVSSPKTSNVEGYLNLEEDVRRALSFGLSQLLPPVSITKRCDLCSKELSLVDASTAIECEKCGFVNDMCEVCRLVTPINSEKPFECFDGVGCHDASKRRLIETPLNTKEAPF